VRQSIRRTLPAALALLASPALAAGRGPWRDVDEKLLAGQAGERVIVPQRYRVLALDAAALRERLSGAPMEFTPEAAARPLELELPLPDGTFARFQVEESPILEPGLARQLPEIKTWRGQGLDDPTLTTRLGWTGAGFHAIVLGGAGTAYIDAYRRGDTRHYLSYWKRDYLRAPDFRCLFETPEDEPPPDVFARIPSGATLRTYRLALAANVEYSDFHSTQVPPSRTDVMNNGIVPTMNRVNGIYEREVASRMVLVANQLNLIFVAEPDGYTNGNGGQMLNANQGIVDGIIGNANYDIGHVFSTGGGGVAGLRVVCVNASKARGVTGRGSPIGDPFDVDYVAHEMGHQFGGNHSFNGNAGSCAGGNRNASTAYEVGSGSTIMAYAGICGAQNLQPNSDDYFHVINLQEIINYTTTGNGNNCPVTAATGNQPPTVDAGLAFNIPSRTPFALTASGSDPDGHPLTYLWEEFDLGPAGDGNTDNGSSPILRSFLAPLTGSTRVFPKLSDILNNVSSYGEKLPTTNRTMQFRVTARDNRAGGGGLDWDQTSVTVTAAAGPFVVTAPNTNVTWPAGQQQTVTWNVAGTSAAPINTASVNIALSTDGGLTFPTVLLSGTPNDGSQAITVPAVATTTARVRVAGAGNVFFDVSDANFTISTGPVAQMTPMTLAVDLTGNLVLEPGENAMVQPAWRNVGTGALPSGTGAFSAFTGPAGPTYSIPDAVAAYGTVLPGNTASCAKASDCYRVMISTGTRPVQHWDASVTETLTPTSAAKVWTLHVGDSFTDVQGDGGFYRFIETLLHEGITSGCGGTLYCPASTTAREQMAVFVLIAKEGAGYTPPACGAPMFGDVPASSPFCRFIEELARRGVASGCGGGNFCPGAAVSREQMAVFVLRTLDPALDPPACTTPVFGDVPASSPFCRWIEELARRGVVSGCGGGNYCPSGLVTREQMAVFLTATFGLELYGP
jgi:hypothetical protein